MPTLWLDNLLAWSIQLALLVAVGTLLPVVLRLRAPRWQLRYYQALLALCLLLPAMQPWRREVILLSPPTGPAVAPAVAVVPAPAEAGPRFTYEEVVLGGLAAGAAFRALWLLFGLARLRKFRRESTPLEPLVGPIAEARAHLAIDATVCLSDEQAGPVTFGFLSPVVLLPKRFLTLAPEAQYSIACHEFLHVHRRDWVQHMAEEIVSIVFWFHPAVWWLVSRIRLAREQAVDQTVIEITHARDRYVDALLTMSGARPMLDLAPAPLFLRRRHLVERISSIVKEVTMSKRRLVSSYLSMGASLAGAAWLVTGVFPLHGLPQVQTNPTQTTTVQVTPRIAAPRDASGVTVTPGGTLMHRAGVSYPTEAIRAGVQGVVILDLSLDAQGNVVDARVTSGPEPLRRAALESALQWHYSRQGAGAARVQAAITFVLPVNPPPPPAPARGAGPTSVILYKVDLSELPEELQTALRPLVAGYEGRQADAVLSELLETVRKLEPHASFKHFYSADKQYIVQVWPPFSGAIGGVIGGVAESVPPPPPPPPPDFPPAADGSQRIRVGGQVQASKLVSQTKPAYPPLARQARIQGVARMNALIGKDGSVQGLQWISGHPLFQQAAMDAVKNWTYQPTLLNGNPVEVVAQVDVNFTLSNEPAAQ